MGWENPNTYMWAEGPTSPLVSPSRGTLRWIGTLKKKLNLAIPLSLLSNVLKKKKTLDNSFLLIKKTQTAKKNTKKKGKRKPHERDFGLFITLLPFTSTNANFGPSLLFLLAEISVTLPLKCHLKCHCFQLVNAHGFTSWPYECVWV